MTPDEEKDLYERIDAVVVGIIHPSGNDDGTVQEFVELIKELVGINVGTRGTLAGIPAHDPDKSAAARGVVIRWLRDRGDIPRIDSRHVRKAY